MPFKPNYRHDRIERERNKQARKAEKLREREEAARGNPDGAEGTPAEDAPGEDAASEGTAGDPAPDAAP